MAGQSKKSGSGANKRLAPTGRSFHERPVSPFALSQLVRRDRTKGGGLAHEPDRRVGQRVRALRPETSWCEGTEQQGAAHVRPVILVRLGPGSSGKRRATRFIRVFWDIPRFE